MRRLILAACLGAGIVAPALAADPARQAILDGLAAQAKTETPGFAGFSAERGAAFFAARQVGGKEDTPSCASCHGSDPTQTGQTRAGKAIEPLAVSRTPARFTDPAKVDKWFGRNCDSVLGRACTALEKGDFITFASSR